MHFDGQFIEKIKLLSRIGADKEEDAELKRQLPEIISFVEQLQSIDTQGVKPTHQVTGLTNVWREDEIIECDTAIKQKIIAQFPAREGNLLATPAIFEDSDEAV